MNALVFLSIYWIPIFLYLIVWSVRMRWYVRKYNIESLDPTHPLTYKVGKLTNFQLLGEALIYCVASILGFFTFLILPRKLISKPILPDD